MRRPLLGIALSAILGTWLGFTFQAPLTALCTCFSLLALIGLAAALLGRAGPWQSRLRAAMRRTGGVVGALCVAFCTVLAAWISAGLYSAGAAGNRLDSLAGDSSGGIEVIGRIAGDVDVVSAPGGGGLILRFPLRLHRVRVAGGEWMELRGRIGVRWHGVPARYGRGGSMPDGPAWGERWRMRGKIRRYGRQRRDGSHYCLSTGKRSCQRLSGGYGSGIGRRCFAARRAAAGLLAVGIADRTRTVGLLRAILLGYRDELYGEDRDLFATTGTLHIFAISGLHVGIVCGILIFVLSVFKITRTRWVLFLGPLLVAYTFATGAKASAVRACIMSIIYFGAPLTGRKADSLSALSLAVVLIIGCAPEQLFRVGFILSFTVVLGIIVMFPIVYDGVERVLARIGILTGTGSEAVMPLFWERDPAQVQEERKLIVWLRRGARYVGSLAALSCAAWLSSAPLTAYYFGRFAPVALIGNIVVIPLALFVVLTGCLALVLGSCVSLFADIFNHANLVLVGLLVGSMKLMAGIPGGSVPVPKPPLGLITLWYAVLGAAVYSLKRRQSRNDCEL